MTRALLAVDEPKQVRGRRWAARLLCVAALLGGGCGAELDKDVAVSPDAEPSLAALMEDGTLSAEMSGGPVGQVPSPRFCEDPGQDGGFPIPGPGPRPPIGVMGPIGIPVVGSAGASAGGAMAMPPAAPPPMTPPSMGGGSSGMMGMAGVPAAGMGSSDGGVSAGMGGGGAAGMGGGNVGDCSDEPIAFWRFNDCSADRTDFNDSSNQDHRSFRHVNQQCVASQEGLGVAFNNNDDLVYAPDQPDFGLDQGVTVAAWVKPDKVDGTRTLFRKRDGNNSAFALLINGKKFQFVVKLKNGKLASVEAPAKANKWSHVAGTYDNSYLRLYVDGVEVRSARAVGVLAKGPGPLLIGNDASSRRVQGVMDNAWFNTMAAPPETIMQLTCLRQAPTFTLNPVDGPPVPAGTVVDYTLSIKSNSSPVCAPEQFFLQAFGQTGDLSVEPSFQQSPPVPAGQTVELEYQVSSGEEAEPDIYSFVIFSFSSSEGEGPLFVQGTYTVAEPTGCHVTSSRELTVRHVSVVDDPIRTSMNGDPLDPRTGAWSFGRLMERLSPSAAAAPDVTEQMFTTFNTPQVVNGFTIEARPGMQQLVLGPWPRTANGKLDLTRAPMRLLAIVNRLDLKDLAAGKAGEGRVVYGVVGPDFELEFTVILEYLLPASNETEYEDWVQQFHALQALPFPSEQYNAALQAITDRFTARNAMPSMPNGSLIIDIRTNEITLSPITPQFGQVWQLREFRPSATTGMMELRPVFLTPDFGFNGTDRLARFINQNEATILADTQSGSGAPLYDVPLTFENQPFQGGSVFNNIDFWDAPGINSNEARHRVSLNTCNGCHGAETNTGFLQIFPRGVGQQSQLSGFLTGTTVFDPVSGQPRRFAELSRRRALMEAVVCDEETP